MPLYRSAPLTDDGGWAVWKVTETEATLRSLLPAEGAYLQELSQFQAHPKRKLERLAVRTLMFNCWKTEHPVAYTPDGRPYLTDGTYSISISHTDGYVALCWHPHHDVSIDIERLSPKALRLSTRFMHPDEHAEGDPLTVAVLHWSSKETLYKLLRRQEDTDFLHHLRIHPFTLASQGQLTGEDLRDSRERFTIDYLLDTDFALTRAMRQPF